MESIADALRVFSQQHPYHNDLELIASQRRTIVGGGRFEIPGRRAGMLARAGVVQIFGGTFGEELELTTKGRRSLRESREAFDLI